MKAASYTRGVGYRSEGPHGSVPFDPLYPQSAGGATQPPMSAVGLGQYRRHCASMSAASLKGYPPVPDFRSMSWSPDSPKKAVVLKNESSAGMSKFIVKLQKSASLAPKFVRNNKREWLSWCTLCLLLIVGYKFFSDGSFSAILTLGSAFQCFSLVLLNLKVISQQSVVGVSSRSIVLMIVCLSLRLVSTLFYNGYLPVDKSGDWVYQAADCVSVLLAGFLLIYSRRYCKVSIDHQKEKDTGYVLLPIVVAGCLAAVVHPTLNQNFVADTAWTFALYLETFAMIPQLFLMSKLGEVESLTSHYVASMAGSKLCSFLFWYFSFAELGPRAGGMNIAGWAVILSYTIQSLLFIDFFYYYVKSIRTGKTMIIDF